MDRLGALALVVLLVGCAPIPPPGLTAQVGTLKDACLASCGGEATVTVTLNGTLYATDEAVCIRSGRMLSCGTCACSDTGLLPAALSSSDTPVDVTCTFRKTETGINVSC